jgi:tungstate transport system substrate-binding protein
VSKETTAPPDLERRSPVFHHIDAARPWAAALVVMLVTVLVAGCSGPETAEESERERLVLASTTSTQDSGLFDVLIPSFEESVPAYDVEVVAVGTGEALELGRRGDADVLLVHATADEEAFVAEGFGTARRDVMYNDFVIVGPAEDPADVRGVADASGALEGIAAAEAFFVSRGDDSGTHKAELALWQESGFDVDEAGAWYLSAGQGMGDSLRLASEKDAYILTDRATYLANAEALESVLLVEGDEALRNQYGVVIVADAANPEGAQSFADWIVAEDAQTLIRAFGANEFGEPLFTPNSDAQG